MTNKNKRLQDPAYYPANYPYCLYQYTSSNGEGIHIAKSATQLAVKKNLPIDVQIKPVSFFEIMKGFDVKTCHEKTNEYLKQFGSEWMCRGGEVFFPSMNAEVSEGQ